MRRPTLQPILEASSAAAHDEMPTRQVHRAPIHFDNYLRTQVWGGRLLQDWFKRDSAASGPYGEAWDISAIAPHISTVDEGLYAGLKLTDLWADHRRELVGGGHESTADFPLLIKWLECRDQLSLQVHPDDQFAQKVLGQPFGKSEAWVILHAEPTAVVYAGVKPGITRGDFEQHLKSGTLERCLHATVPRAGDCFSFPAGTIHAAGGGLLLAEVQQSSDATFRLFDWNRPGLDGRPRPLQVELGLDAVNWDQGAVNPCIPDKLDCVADGVVAERLCEMSAFTLERYRIEAPFPVPHSGELTIWMTLSGSGELRATNPNYGRSLTQGDTILLPASGHDLVWHPSESGGSLLMLCARLPRNSRRMPL